MPDTAINPDHVRTYVNTAIDRAKAAEALPRNRAEALARAAAAIARTEGGDPPEYVNAGLAIADRWMVLADAFSLI